MPIPKLPMRSEKVGTSKKYVVSCISIEVALITPTHFSMVGEMVQNSQSSYSFTFNAVIGFMNIFIHIQQLSLHSRNIFIITFSGVSLIHEYIYSHLRDIVIHIQRVIFVHIHDRNIHSAFSAHALCASLGASSRSIISKRTWWMKGTPNTNNPKHKCYMG